MVWQITAQHLLTDVSTNNVCDSDGHGGFAAMGLYMGRQPDPRLLGTVDLTPVNHDEPHERTADGCPGGWYRTPFCDSLAPYLRRRAEGGGRVDNPLFTAATWQIQEAAMYVEHEQERRQGWISEKRFKRAEAARKKAARKRK